MKRLKTFLLVLTTVCAVLSVRGAGRFGTYIEVDGVAYEVASYDENNHYAYIVKRADGQPYSGDLVIPQYLVYDGEDIENLHHGDSILVTYIVDAFQRAEITSLTLPPSIKRINYNSAFSDCKYLKSLELPEGLVGGIAPDMFSGCESLESLFLPSTFEEWRTGAFRKCPNLKNVTVASNHPKYDSRDNCNGVVETATNTLISASSGTVLPSSIDSIGLSAFSGLAIDSIYIPENIKCIDAVSGTGIVVPHNFQVAANISSKSILVKDIETWCNLKTKCYFFEQPNGKELNYKYNEPRAGLPLFYEKLYLGDKLVRDTLVIPDNVKRVANFFASRYLKSVSIPSSVEEIASYAFFGCDSLTEVHIAEGTKTIGEAAFASCCSITSLTLPSTLQSVGRGAFGGCSKLETVVLKAAQPPLAAKEMFDESVFQNATLLVPNGCKALYEQADGWKQFQSIADDVDDMDNFHPTFEVDGYLYHVISAKDKEVEMIPDYDPNYDINGSWGTPYKNYRYKGDIVIPETVTDNGITYTVTRLGHRLFMHSNDYAMLNYDVTSVKIPRTIKEIHTELGPFDIYIEDLTAWCNIEFAKENPSVGRGMYTGSLPSPGFMVPNNLYVNGQLIENLVIPDGVTSISDAAFMGFAGIKSVSFPASVSRIGTQAFRHSAITSIRIPSTVKSIGDGAFEGCSYLSSLTIEDGVSDIGASAFADCLDLKKVSIPASVKNIQDFTFRWCNSLEELTIADGIESLGEWSFYQCDKVEKISVPASVKTIGRNAFNACKSLKTVNLSEGLEAIDRYAFTNCTSLETLHIPASVKNIGRNVVEDCPNLKSLTIVEGNTVYDTHGNSNAIYETDTNSIIAVSPEATIPEGIETVGDYAFAYCSDRQSIVLPEGIKTLGDYAFLHCWSLHTITIPKSVEHIGHKTFDSCESLESVIAKADEPCQMEEDAFSNETYHRATLYVPDEAIDKYRQAEGWKNFEHIEGHSALSSGIEPVAYRPSGDVEIKTDGRRVLLYNLKASERVRVYSLDGKLIKDVVAAPDGRAVLMFTQRGAYIVKTQAQSVKVNL